MSILVKLATLGLMLGARSAIAALNGSYVWVTNTSELSPIWMTTSNSEFSTMLGTYLPKESSAATNWTYCASAFFNASSIWGEVTLTSKLNCTVRFDEVHAVFPRPDLAVYLSIPRGPACADDGVLTLTRVNFYSGLSSPEVVTLDAPGFLPVDSAHFKVGTQGGTPGKNYFISGRNDLLITQYRPGEATFTVARAAIEYLNGSRLPALINLTTVQYDLQLKQQPLSYAQTTIDLRNQTPGWTNWYYSPPLLLLTKITNHAKQLMLTWYNGGIMGTKAVINATNMFFYGIELYPYNQTAFIVSSTMMNNSTTRPRHLYLVNEDGTVRQLTDSVPSELTDLVVLRKNHAHFKRGSLLGLIESYTFTPTLLYLDPNADSEVYELSMHKSWWEFFGITESADAIHLEEAKNRAGVTQLGTWRFNGPADPTTTNVITTTMASAVTTPPKTLPQTKQTSFFWSNSTQPIPASNTNVILLGGGCSLLIMGLAASLAYCLRWLYLRHTAEEQNEKYVPLASV